MATASGMPYRGLAAAVLVILAGLPFGCATRSPLPAADPPPRAQFGEDLIQKGARLAAIGNCASCHTAQGGKPYAGGRPIETPFGAVHGTNITPDPVTGIGRWTEAAFRRAMREGLDREGRHLYPAFPYEYFTKLSDEDIHALYAFVMTRDPVVAENPANELGFPFNVRSLIGIWKQLYFEPRPFQRDPTQSAQWNRGAYLVQGLAHCSACHTPRNRLGAEDTRRPFAGGEAGGWHGPALDASNPAPVPWSAEQLYVYLRTGLDDMHAIAAGPMAPVVRNLAQVPQDEVRAIAQYTFTLGGTASDERRKKAAEAIDHAKRDQAGGARARLQDTGAALYASACASCHDQGRLPGSEGALHLALGTAMTVPTSMNLVRITLEGIFPPEGEAGRWMPGFANSLTEAQARELIDYIRSEFGRLPPWPDVRQQVEQVRKSTRKSTE